MPDFRVYFEGSAGATVTVSDVDLSNVDVNNSDAVAEVVREAAYRQGTPTLCAHCSGYGSKDSLSIPDDWDAYEVTDIDGNVIWTGDVRS